MKKIIDEVARLKEQPMIAIGRASNLLWIHFGKLVEVKNYRGIGYTKGEYALHVQCPWRFIHNNTLILGSDDFYLPVRQQVDVNFEWDIVGANIFDQKVNKITSEILPLQVEGIKVDEIGNLKINFRKGIVLEVFPVSSCKMENWRFINNITGEHAVIFEE